ncbi:MAG: hypothetical protein AAB845_00320, partial [Patescibacteria group bacterium]
KETPVVESEASVQAESDELIEPAETPLISFTHITDNWHAILETAKELNASLSVALSTATPKNVENNTVTLGVKYPFHKERLDDKANQLTLMEAFDRILGFKLGLRVEVEQEETSQENSTYLDNPLISQALNLLGGKVAS